MADTGMAHRSVYPGGMSRGDTPPKEIPTLGAAGGKPKVSEVKLAELAKPCPFAVDENARFAARHEGMSMNVIEKCDVPPGPMLFNKDYDRSLMVEDIELAQPTLAHPSSISGVPIPWKYFQHPEKEVVEKSTAKSHYPSASRRPRDLSLRTDDIELAQAKKRSHGPRQRSECVINPITPSYQFTSQEGPPVVAFRPSGRDLLDCSDIDGAKPSFIHPIRNQYGNPLRCELEFQSRGKQAAAAGKLVAGGLNAAYTTPLTARSGCLREKEDDGKRPLTHREGHPLEPRYKLDQPTESAPTTLHARYGCERFSIGDDAPACAPTEIGHVEGSKPRTLAKENGEPQRSLITQDIVGARTRLKVGVLPYSMYGPMGKRPVQSNNLNTADIVGAQASTIPNGPKMPNRYERPTQTQTVGSSIVGLSQTPRASSRPQSGALGATLGKTDKESTLLPGHESLTSAH
eukprot:TRINITY_DN66810_c0_g1_i1.p1 TRINITY_DN66810_c0_g1~~TRINITY_DN66810_c0_g1_i1.p1  ORF type:complete len:460 (+),score=63.75 TRINITY_DN66810_c0_g1_i1:133-1512(+)